MFFQEQTSLLLGITLTPAGIKPGYKGGPLPKGAMDAFCILQNSLTSEPVMAFPWADCQYALITDAATGMAETARGLGAILTQRDEFDKFFAISYSSRQLKDHEKNYSLFLLEVAAAVWGMGVFNEYLKGKKFILYTDHNKNGTPPHKNDEQIASGIAGT